MIKNLSLLERAKALPVRKNRNNRITSDEIELAVAWLQDEVSLSNAAIAMNTTHGSAINRIALALREAYQQGFFKKK